MELAFGGLKFIFDGIGSDQYGLQICSINGRGEESSSGGTNANLHTDKSSGSYKFNLLGVSEDEPLTFRLSFGTLSPMTRQEISSIQKWLFGHKEYKKLRIIQDDMTDLHYNCILSDSEIETLANYPFVISCNVTCDSQFAWEEDKTHTYSNFTTDIILINTSDIKDYTYPLIEFTVASTTVSFINKSNGNWGTVFEKLTVGEKITLDNEHQIITSSTGLRRLGNFNKKWFELKSGENILAITGVSELKVTYANARRVGA